MNLQENRKLLDRLDFQILKLLNSRMEMALKIKKYKASVEDLKRETLVLENIRKHSPGLIAPGFCESLFREIIAESKRLQGQDYQLVGFQGEHGAYSEVASKVWNNKLVPIPCIEFTEIFDGVKTGLYDFGIVPVENTLGGIVSQVNQLLIKTDLSVVGAVSLPVHHCLLAREGTDRRELRTVYSHSQALEQCHHFLATNRLEPVPYFDTAGAAKMLIEKAPPASGAIASELAADLYHLEIVEKNIEDFGNNVTRFLVLSKGEISEKGGKYSVVFSTEHKAGDLFQVLEVFAKAGLNLTRIESIPNREGNFAFFLDFIGSKENQNVGLALEQVESMTRDFKLLGCYDEKMAE